MKRVPCRRRTEYLFAPYKIQASIRKVSSSGRRFPLRASPAVRRPMKIVVLEASKAKYAFKRRKSNYCGKLRDRRRFSLRYRSPEGNNIYFTQKPLASAIGSSPTGPVSACDPAPLHGSFTPRRDLSFNDSWSGLPSYRERRSPVLGTPSPIVRLKSPSHPGRPPSGPCPSSPLLPPRLSKSRMPAKPTPPPLSIKRGSGSQKGKLGGDRKTPDAITTADAKSLKFRRFEAGVTSGRNTIWYESCSSNPIQTPSIDSETQPGELYLHFHHGGHQMWVMGSGGDWLKAREGQYHPQDDGVTLHIRPSAEPLWRHRTASNH